MEDNFVGSFEWISIETNSSSVSNWWSSIGKMMPSARCVRCPIYWRRCPFKLSAIMNISPRTLNVFRQFAWTSWKAKRRQRKDRCQKNALFVHNKNRLSIDSFIRKTPYFKMILPVVGDPLHNMDGIIVLWSNIYSCKIDVFIAKSLLFSVISVDLRNEFCKPSWKEEERRYSHKITSYVSYLSDIWETVHLLSYININNSISI